MKLELQGVTKAYGRIRALDKVSLEFVPGEIVAVLGPNGAGKTTLLRCLMGLMGPDNGHLLCDGEAFRRDRLDFRRQLFFLPDVPLVMPDHSVLKHIGMMLHIYEATGPGVEDRVVELLTDFELLPVAEAPLATLSRGQLYKAALCGLIAVNPSVWLLDEPFASGMDPHGLNAFRRHARAAARAGRTIVFTTQLVELAERFADRLCVIHHGELKGFDTPAALRAKAAQEGGPLAQLFSVLTEPPTS